MTSNPGPSPGPQAKHVSLPSTFASGSIAEWFVHFDICSKANGWNDETKAPKLPTLLEGEASASWLELTEEEQVDFKLMKEKLITKMVPLPFTALEEFHACKLHPGEPLSLFMQDQKRLLQSAMPALDKNTGEQMSIHQFLMGLQTAISRWLCATGEAKGVGMSPFVDDDRQSWFFTKCGCHRHHSSSTPGQDTSLKGSN